MVDIHRYRTYRSTDSFIEGTDYTGMQIRIHVKTEAATENIHIGEKLEDGNMKLDNVNEEILFICAPNLLAFNFVQKIWSYINVELLNEISFDDEAFDKLILDQTRKDLIKSLVKFNYNIKTDLISGKVRKTLTAEAISEMLHRPLYSNAVILLDEADIFLERRSAHDIERNALSTFLELMNCNHNNINLKKLSKKHFNRREIKNAVIIAKTINEEKNEPITTELLEKILNVSNNKISENIAEEMSRKDPKIRRKASRAVSVIKF
ncbi:P-loop containing nucleoside triphosphate hydrolase protein [Gigaspora margarita]|uniref:P-loop containing nucleoside triphosphate hydrolase protein n=1 Tax=Gigaspora margarita TaxID=4874 RepID=A0A8H4A9Z6_GIGMA|nr:P-loop containing nucleoside triphosphate hydrolase protein [Gigaspora margarita]